MNPRRRLISILAGVTALAPFSAARAQPASATSVWRGTAMGALASLTLVHPDRAKAQALIADCVAEVQRLEGIFSLYRADSALARLNAAGELQAPPAELIELLSAALELSRRSAGAFDPTVQPLYRLYAEHFAAPRAAPGGPSPEAIARVLPLIGHAAVDVAAERVRLHRPGMALTLNGIAQGFVTDRVAGLLRRAGFDDVLIDMGEARALGHRPDGGAWRAAVADPRRPGRSLLELHLGEDRGDLPALATSAGAGTQFGPDPRIHHLLDPHTGRSANHWLSVSVAAPSATLADGLSTTLSVLAPARGVALLREYAEVRAYFADAQGQVLARGAS